MENKSTLRKLSKKLIVRFPWLYALTIKIFLLLAKLRTKWVIIKLRRAGLPTITAAEIIRDINRHFSIDQDAICHVVATGWSLNSSRNIIEPSHFVIGFNDAAISGLKFDLYFQEIASWKLEAISKHAIKQIEEIILPQGSLLYFKNVWSKLNDVSFMKKHWGDKVKYVNDIDVICLDLKYIDKLIEDLFAEDTIYLRQYSTSTLTSIVLAARAGFKKIVVHGLDFGGPYFFEMPQFVGLDHLKPEIFPKRRTNDVHETAHERGIKTILGSIRTHVNLLGAELYSGSKVSPSSEILPTYKRPEF